MTIQEALDQIDELKVNTYSTHQKIRWLSDLDGKVWNEIIMAHEGVPKGVVFEGYDDATPPDTVLLAPGPYAEIYVHWLSAKIDDNNRDTQEYNKSMISYNQAWQDLGDYWTRTHMPVSRAPQFRF